MAIIGCCLWFGSQAFATNLELSDLNNSKITEAFVDGLVLPLMKNHNSPSGVVSITKGGEIIFAKAFGYQNIAKQIPAIADKTIFRPASVSKLFTWVSVMQMVEQGKLDLDTDVNKYLKTFQIKDTYPGDPITMRHIMTHTAGFEEGSLGYMIVEDIERVVPLAESMKRYQPERVNPPGKQTAYSNYATSIAGLIVANLSGIEFTDYIQKNIFDVLGMNSSSFKEPLPEHLNKNLAVGYVYGAGKYIEKPIQILAKFAPAGAMSATATDMSIFAQTILNGGEYNGNRILKEETVQLMLSRSFSHDDRMMGMALGFYETEHNGLRFVGHAGDIRSFHSELVIDQENDMSIFISFSGGGGAIIRSAFKSAFYDTFYSVKKEEISIPEDFAKRADKYAGNYLFWRSGFSTLEKVYKTNGGISVQPTADNTLAVNFGDTISQYVEIDNNLFLKIDGSRKLAFQENEEGEITGFVLDRAPFASTFKASWYQNGRLHIILFGLSMLIFLAVILRRLLRRLYQRDSYKSLPPGDKTAMRAALLTASGNWITIIIGGIVMLVVMGQFSSGIPLLLKLWLTLPFVVVILGAYLFYQTVLVWKNELYQNIWQRIRYSVVAICALFTSWFYAYWNILGFNYFN